jgi:hypothetical protein
VSYSRPLAFIRGWFVCKENRIFQSALKGGAPLFSMFKDKPFLTRSAWSAGRACGLSRTTSSSRKSFPFPNTFRSSGTGRRPVLHDAGAAVRRACGPSKQAWKPAIRQGARAGAVNAKGVRTAKGRVGELASLPCLLRPMHINPNGVAHDGVLGICATPLGLVAGGDGNPG